MIEVCYRELVQDYSDSNTKMANHRLRHAVGKEQHLVHCYMYTAFYPSCYAPVNLRKPGFMNDDNSRKKVERTQLCAHNHDLYKTC